MNKRMGIWALLVLLVGLCHVAQAKNTVTIYLTNPQGTPIMTTDAQGHVTSTKAYRPYGTQVQGAAEHGPGYTGHVNDPDTGLVYMQARYYDPTGRFLSVDPVSPTPGNIFNFNRYAYANNNPVRYTDPDGRCIEDFCITEGAAAGCAVTGPACPIGAAAGALVGIAASAVIIIVVHHEISDKSNPEAKDNRDKSRTQGIPDSKIGPSGKPKRHSVDHPTKKRAKDAAREDSGAGGAVEKHANPVKGNPHYHGKDRKGNKDRTHHNYPGKKNDFW